MHEKNLSIGLFDPGMTELHRVGLAGLYMTLKSLNPERYADAGGWELTPHRVHIHWKKKPRDLFKQIFEDAFQISSEGCIMFKAHHDHPMGDLERLQMHRTICLTYLQHPQVCRTEKTEKAFQFDFQDKNITQTIKPVTEYGNRKAIDLFLNTSGEFKQNVKLAGWVFLGGTVRHVAHPATTLSTTPELFLPLVFAPVATLYFLISHRDRDGRWDSRKHAAVVLPHIQNLATYDDSYKRYLAAPVQRLYADSLGDAALLALSLLRLHTEMLKVLAISSCTVMTFGAIPWSRQKTRTGFRQVAGANAAQLNFFSLALDFLDNRAVVKDDGGFYVVTSPCRGLIAENIAEGKDWFNGFHQLMASQKLARRVYWERKGLNEMIGKMEWNHEADRLLVEAVHQALRNRYGALAQRAREKGEVAQFGREFERVRTALMRAKNAQTMRAELADLFARAGLNKTLQQRWSELLPLFTGEDWQRARDLALLALASYAGQGAETIIESEIDNTLEEEETE
jgi:CRISPR-associated protein Cas8a1/Csx13